MWSIVSRLRAGGKIDAGVRIRRRSACVFGRGNIYSRAKMGVNEYGNGAVSTWDKNSYRLATLGKGVIK